MRWLCYPEEIEADLAFRGIDIGHWHRLTIDPETGGPKLSSRRLLVLLDKLPESSEFKKASERDGDWSLAEYAAFGTYNVVDRLLAVYCQVHSSEDHPSEYEPFTFRSPAQERKQLADEAEELEYQEEASEDLYAQFGWS